MSTLRGHLANLSVNTGARDCPVWVPIIESGDRLPPDPEFRALLHACRVRPGEETPVLAAADWLADHGHDREAAAFRAFVQLRRAAAAFADTVGPAVREVAEAVRYVVEAVMRVATTDPGILAPRTD